MLIVLGWTLMYWPHLAHGFSYAQGLEPTVRNDFLDALYISLVMVATLGLGDIVPVEGWLRVVAPLQALIGFALLTALVSWVSQIYPALTRRRVLALRLASLRDAAQSVGQLTPALAVDLTTSLAVEVTRVRVDFAQRAETYYFRDGEDRSSLAAMIGFASDLAAQGQASPSVDLRVSAAMLSHTLEDLAAVLNRQFLHLRHATPIEIFHAYATDHGHTLVRS
ncbi:potassium channel family protein [Streptomyces sp. enrichment culture]|uniref:potassium channel family protein n=1 Tax=Streptomyces sp. enrichment culture TaxID=1795815 RepID=UPI003F577C45